MPNWCDGYLTIRGKKKDLKNFIENEIRLVKLKSILSEPEYIGIKMIDDSMGCSFKYNKSYSEFLHLKNSRRFFIESEEISFFSVYDDTDCYLTLKVKQAWGINVQELLVEHSKNYHVDFNIYASESGMEFEQYITVVEGELIKDEEREYTDFHFEAINPSLGG